MKLFFVLVMTSLLEVTAEAAAKGKDGVIWAETEDLGHPLCLDVSKISSILDINSHRPLTLLKQESLSSVLLLMETNCHLKPFVTD